MYMIRADLVLNLRQQLALLGTHDVSAAWIYLFIFKFLSLHYYQSCP